MKNMSFFILMLLFTTSCSSSKNYSMPPMRESRVAASESYSKSIKPEAAPAPKINLATGGNFTKQKRMERLVASKNTVPAGVQTESSNTTDNQSQKQPVKRILIYSAFIKIEVLDIKKPLENAIKLAEKLGGYIKYRNNTSLTIRIPVQNFKEYMHQIDTLGNITTKEINAKDVTEAYMDMQIRLNNLLATQKRLREILKKAVKVKDILAVEKELNRVTGEIEMIKGRLRYLKNLADYSTVNILFYKKYIPTKSGSYNKFILKTPAQWIKFFNINSLLQ